MSGMMTAMPVAMQRPALQTDRAYLQCIRIRSDTHSLRAIIKELSWDREFQTQETMLNAYIAPVAETVVESVSKPAPAGEMAELAARVIDAVKDEQNPKFQQSQFMSLMRQFRDGEVVVEDDKIVPSESSTATRVDVKGKGRAVDIPVREVHQPGEIHSGFASSIQGYQGSIELNEAYRHQRQDADDIYFRRENEEYSEYWDAHYTGPVPNTVSAGDRGSWHELQEAWDALEATSTGIKPVVNYQFQVNNPYLLGDSSRTHQHEMHMSQAQRLYEVSRKIVLLFNRKAES
jgi:peroxin-5